MTDPRCGTTGGYQAHRRNVVTVGRGEVVAWNPPPLARAASTVTITPRLADVLTGLAHGLTNKDIARRLNLSEDTVKTHVRKILRALGARDRCHATALAVSGQITINVRKNPWRRSA